MLAQAAPVGIRHGLRAREAGGRGLRRARPPRLPRTGLPRRPAALHLRAPSGLQAGGAVGALVERFDIEQFSDFSA